jgi:primosomal protein N'
MKTEELKEEIERNILECPYNKMEQDKEHECSDCNSANDILRAELKGRTEATQEIINFIENTFEGLDENWIMKKTIIKKFQEGK